MNKIHSNFRISSGRMGRRWMAGMVLPWLLTAASAQSTFADWSKGKYATGEWLGARPALEERGIVLGGSWKSTFYGVVDGGLRQAGSFDEELHFNVKLDFEKLAGITGLIASAAVRWRDGDNVDANVGASPAFNPSSYQVGKQWRLMPFFLTWESQNLLPVEDMVTLSAGWLNPYQTFVQQPESKLFVNNAITQTKGLGANIPFNGTYAAWGGFAKVKPTAWSYLQSGLYAAIPNATSTANHGLDLALARPPGSNGLYFMAESGVTPKIANLPGKYAMGAYYWGLENRSFFGTTYDQKFGFYWQADQMLFRESSPAPTSVGDGKTLATGKNFQEPVKVVGKPNEQGLYFFSFLNFAPQYDNALPLYFHTGLVYKGLIPARDKDQIGLAFGFGEYSNDLLLSRRNAGLSTQQTTEAVLEGDYRVQLTQFAYVQPFVQYLIRPNGTGLVENATLLGVHLGVIF